MEAISSILYFVLVLGILVFVHELGHFLMARFVGIRVNTFALGMGFRLFGWNKKTGFTFGKLPDDLELEGDTDYRISAFPIGGYCQMAGMVDESFDTEFAGQEPKDWEFRSKNSFQKALAISGGVLFNILLAIIFFTFIIFKKGESTHETTTLGAVENNSIGSMIGFQAGDEIISINNQNPQNWSELIQFLAIDNLGKDLNIAVRRNGRTQNLFVDGKEQTSNLASNIPLGIEPDGIRTVILDVMPDGLAKENGILANDTVISVNSENVFSSADFRRKLDALKNQEISLVVKNESGKREKNFKLGESGMIGVQIGSCITGKMITINYTFFESIARGTAQVFNTFGFIISSLKQIIIGNLEFKQAFGGPIVIAQMSSKSAESGLYTFLNFVAMLSISLALINILPVPALDGGHLIIIIVEGVARREIPIKAKLVIQQVGLFLVLALMAYIIFNDIQKVL